MKNKNFKIIVFQTTMIMVTLFGVSSCNTNQKSEDIKEIAKDQNKEMYNDTEKEIDAFFLVNAAEINLKEIQLAQLAQQKSNADNIKELGKMMEATHRQSLNDLIALASKKSIAIPSSLTDNAQEDYKKLTNTDDADFDKEYCDLMVSGHKDAIALFEKASTESKDADIKAWALSTLPVLQSHLDHSITSQLNNENRK